MIGNKFVVLGILEWHIGRLSESGVEWVYVEIEITIANGELTTGYEKIAAYIDTQKSVHSLKDVLRRTFILVGYTCTSIVVVSLIEMNQFEWSSHCVVGVE